MSMNNVLSDNLKVQVVSETPSAGVFDIEGLYRGYGLTLGNALRRVLLSSLPGVAITSVKIKGVGHEFSTIPGIIEDVVEIMLNLKKVRLALDGDFDSMNEPAILTLSAKGEGAVTAAAIEEGSRITVMNPETHIATISQKGTELEIELTVEKGLGYVPVESFKAGTLPIGVVKLDALFSPVIKVNFSVENMRVGEFTDFNRLRLDIETTGSITPSSALKESLLILQTHFAKAADQIVVAKPEASEEKPKAKAKKVAKKKSAKE